MHDSIPGKLHRSIADNAKKSAFIYEDRHITYQQLGEYIDRTALKIHDAGIKPKQVIGLSMGQTPLHCIAMLALARIGAVCVPVNSAFPAIIKSRIIHKYDITCMIVDDPSRAIAELPFLELNWPEDVAASSNQPSLGYEPEPEAPLLIAIPLLLSMSSAEAIEPRAIMYTHRYMLQRISRTLDHCDSETRMIPADLNFTMGYICALGLLITGGTVVIPSSSKAQDIIETIHRHEVSDVFFSSRAAEAIDSLLPMGNIAFPSLKHLRILEGIPSPALLEKLRTKFTPNFYISFGSAETGGLTLATPELLAEFPTSSGKARPWAELQIVDSYDQELPTGKTGEIRARGELLPVGYFNDHDHTRMRFRHGWFYTGERGYIDSQGLLFLE